MVDSVVNGLFVPLSMLYLSASSGTSLVQVGTLLSVAGLLSLPLPLWIGGLVDRLGPKPIVLVAQLLQAAGFLGYLMVRSSGRNAAGVHRRQQAGSTPRLSMAGMARR